MGNVEKLPIRKKRLTLPNENELVTRKELAQVVDIVIDRFMDPMKQQADLIGQQGKLIATLVAAIKDLRRTEER